MAVQRHGRAFYVVSAIVAVLVVALVVLRLALPSIILRVANHTLATMKGASAHIDDVDIALIRGAYVVKGLRVTMRDAKKGQPPLLHVDEADISIDWRALFDRSLVCQIVVRGATVRVISTKKQTKTVPIGELQQKIKQLAPFDINRVRATNVTVAYLDDSGDRPAQVEIDNIALVATNLTNSKKLSKAKVATVDVSGGVYNHGEIKVHADVDPFARLPTFSVAAEARHIPLTKLNELTREKLKIHFAKGSLSVFIEAELKDGAYHGYVKPLIHNMQLVNGKDPPLNQIVEGVATALSKLVENLPKKQIASKIPFSGTLENPNVDIVTTVAQLLRNAFVQALKPMIDGDIAGVNALEAAPEAVKKK
ncbi:MAG TPA: DUF748 domain-containing protein [Myxococcota bacterium]